MSESDKLALVRLKMRLLARRREEQSWIEDVDCLINDMDQWKTVKLMLPPQVIFELQWDNENKQVFGELSVEKRHRKYLKNAHDMLKKDPYSQFRCIGTKGRYHTLQIRLLCGSPVNNLKESSVSPLSFISSISIADSFKKKQHKKLKMKNILKYKCPFCWRKFPNLVIVHRHLKWRHKQKKHSSINK